MALKNALAVVVQAWGKTVTSVNGQVVFALGVMQLRYQHLIDQKELVRKLSNYPGGPGRLLGNGRAAREANGRPVHHCIAQLCVDVYNRGRRTNKLDSFESFDHSQVEVMARGSRKRGEDDDAEFINA